MGFACGTITACYATGTVHGSSVVGGLMGVNWYDGNVTRCYTTDAVSGDNYIGGLTGFNCGTIMTCYATGTVDGEQGTGGLLGWNYGDIGQCYATGTVSAEQEVGGLVGWNDGTITACFWDVQASGQATSSGGEGKTTAEMQTLSTFISAGWDFVGEPQNGTDDTWRMCVDGLNSPRVWWEFAVADIACPNGISLTDFSVLAINWLRDNTDPLWYNNADINADGSIGIPDLLLMCESWLTGTE